MKLSFGTRLWLAVAVAAALTAAVSAVYAHEGRHVGEYEFVVGFSVEPALEGWKNGVDLRVTKMMEHTEGEGHGGMSMDVEEHGAIFGSPALAPGETFTLQVTHEMEGPTIPYHSHLSENMAGSLTVSDDAELSGTVAIAIRDGAYHPADVTVKPGTTLAWTNNDSMPQTVTSGFHAGAGHTHEEEPQAMPVEGLEGTLQVEVTHVPTGASKVFRLQSVFGEPGHYRADLIPTAPGQYRFRFLGTVDGTEVDEVFESGPGQFSDIEPAGELHFPEKLPAVREIEGAARGAQSMAEQATDTANSVRTLALLGMVLGAFGIVSGAAATVVALRSR